MDKKSVDLLNDLIHIRGTRGMDRTSVYTSKVLDDLTAVNGIEYHYLGSRLVKLHELAKDPRARSRWRRFLKRHISEKNALLVAVMAMVLSTCLGAVQLYFTIDTWKHPVHV